jgi:hypothetical protein
MQIKHEGLDRREFLGAAAAVALTPAASLMPTGPVAAAVTGPERLCDWTIDDQWNAYPRYAAPIGYGRRTAVERPSVHPADEAFLAI